MPRRHRGHPEEAEPGDADLEGPAPADLLQMWISGRQPPTGTTSAEPVDDEASWSDAVHLPWTGPDDDPAVPVAEVAEDVVEEAAEPPEKVGPDPDPEPDPGPEPEQAEGWASFGHARTAEDVLDETNRNPWLDVLLSGTSAPPHPPAEPARPALLRELDHDAEPPDAAGPDEYDPDATAHWTFEDFDAYDRAQSGAEAEPIPELESVPVSVEPLTEAPAERVDLGWPEEPDDAWEDAFPPVGGVGAYAARWGSADDWQSEDWQTGRQTDWQPDRWQSSEPPVAEDPPVLEVVAPPQESTPEEATPEPVDVVAEPVTPDQPTLFEEQAAGPDLPWDPDSTQDIDPSAEQAVPVPRQPRGRLDVPERVAADALGVASTTGEDGDGPEIPQDVEYKQRAAYRPLLRVLFVLAAVLAVGAIFWAVSQGSRSSIGIAIGVTGFALAFWWGLLSWTPTAVSLHGPILEVARGADGERFDLRDPDLDIDVDDDTTSRTWRVTITRPNETDLVIPASAVDPDELAAIVQHYRGDVEHQDHPSR